MLPEHKPIFDKLDDAQALALTMYGEARGESREGMLAVGSVIMHRAHLGYFPGKKSIKGVCFGKTQFSCFNGINNDQYPIMVRIAGNFTEEARKIDKLHLAYSMAKALIEGILKPNVQASFYKRVDVHFPDIPEKNLKKVATIGAHEFFRESGDKSEVV